MQKTIEKIESVMLILDKWGLTKDLTKHELETLRFELIDIAGTAVMESQNAIQNILPTLYQKLRN